MLTSFSPEVNPSRLSDRQVWDRLIPHIEFGHIRFEKKIILRGSPSLPRVEVPTYDPTPSSIVDPVELRSEPTAKSKLGPVQASALLHAAKKGAPFCAKCEEMKRQKEQEEREYEPVPPPEIKEFSKEELIVAALQADVLIESAQKGAPFCEKCEAAKKERAAKEPADSKSASAGGPAAASPEPDEKVDPVVQAAVLTAASEEGTPFCEKCEAARKEAA